MKNGQLTEMSTNEEMRFVDAFCEAFAQNIYNMMNYMSNTYFYPDGYNGVDVRMLPEETKLALISEVKRRIKMHPVEDILRRLDVLEGRVRYLRTDVPNEVNLTPNLDHYQPAPPLGVISRMNHTPQTEALLKEFEGDVEGDYTEEKPAFNSDNYSDSTEDSVGYLCDWYLDKFGHELHYQMAEQALDMMRSDYPDSDEWFIRSKCVHSLTRAHK